MSSTDIVPEGNALVQAMAASKHQPVDVRHRLGGVQLLFRFPNGYGASLINHAYSLGLELAVIEWDDTGYHVTYDTPVTDDVLGWLPPEQIEDTLNRIAALPVKETER